MWSNSSCGSLETITLRLVSFSRMVRTGSPALLIPSVLLFHSTIYVSQKVDSKSCLFQGCGMVGVYGYIHSDN